jgi:hypothetical protein
MLGRVREAAALLSRRWSMPDRQSISWNGLPSPNVVILDW